jgi:hypothetical protein
MPYAGGMARYRKPCTTVVVNGYEGFALSFRAVLSTRLKMYGYVCSSFTPEADIVSVADHTIDACRSSDSERLE